MMYTLKRETQKIPCGKCGESVEVVTLEGLKLNSIYCPECEDQIRAEEEIEITRQALQYIADLRQERTKHYKRYAEKCGLPPRYHDADLYKMDVDNNNQEAVKAAYDFLENPRSCLLLTGDTGRGKTWIAAAITRELILQGLAPLFTTASDLFSLLADSYRRDSFEASFAKIKKLPALIIDDLGVEKTTDRALEHMYGLIDFRYSWEKGTVITSNLSGRDIGERYGTRIMSRIKQSGKAVEVKGKDRRLQA